MHVLHIPLWFPNHKDKYNGDFVYDLVLAQNKYSSDVEQLGILVSESQLYFWENLIQEDKYPEIPKEINFIRNKGKRYPLSWPLGQLLYQVQLRALYLKYIEKFGEPDIIHSHVFPTTLACLKIKGSQTKLVYIEHMSRLISEDDSYAKDIVKIGSAAAQSDAVIGISKSMKKELDKSSSSVVLVPNPVNIHEFLPKKKLGLKFSFVSVGYLEKRKGFDVIIHALAELRKEISSFDIEFHIIGDGEEEAALKQLVETLELENNVIFHGKWKKEKIASELGGYHAFVMGSHFEAFGIVVTEAISCGLPVIATRSGGPQDVITSDHLGRIVAPGSVLEMKSAMKEVYLNYSEYNSDKIRQHAIDNYSQETVVQSMDKVYRKVLSCVHL